MATVKFGYESSRNISFKGQVDTEIEREDWDEMSADEQQAVETQIVFELVDLYEISDDEEAES